MDALDRIARYVTTAQFDEIPKESVHAAKRLLADTIGCAAAGWDRNTSRIARKIFPEVAGPLQATVWGSGEKAWIPAAVMVNGAMVREPEINDTFTDKTPAHPSESIPTAIALCEAKKRGGREFLTAMVSSYEVYSRLCQTAKLVGGERGWHHTTFGIIVIPALASRCLGLDLETTKNAMAISSSYGVTLNQLHLGDTTGLRTLAYPFTAFTGITATLLAEAGLAGPHAVLSGPHGFYRQLFEDEFDLSPFSDWSTPLIVQSSIKQHGCSYYIATTLTALRLVLDSAKIESGSIDRIVVELTQRPYEVVAQKSRARPETLEAADHSLPFCVGLLATRGTVYPMDFTAETLKNPEVLRIVDLVEVKVNKELDQEYPLHRARPAIVSVYSGGKLVGKVTSIYPLGDYRDPLSDAQLFEKFVDLTGGWYSREQADRVWNAVFSLEDCKDIGELVVLALSGSRPGSTPRAGT